MIKPRLYVTALLLALVSFSAVYGAGTVLKTIPEIRKLSPNRAAKGLSVSVTSQIVRLNAFGNGLFLFDGTNGIYVAGTEDETVIQALEAGDIVRVDGITTPGGFAPTIQALDVQVVDHQPVPEARQIQNNDLLSTYNDCAWLMVRGRLISMAIAPNKRSILLEVNRNQRTLDVQLPYSEANVEKVRELLFSYVKFNAVAGTVYNLNRQAVGRIFFVNAADDISTTGYQYNMNVETQSEIHELMRFKRESTRPVQTHGTVLFSDVGEVYLRGEQACLKVWTSAAHDAQVGDEVTIEGLVSPQRVSPGFRARSVQVTGDGAVPQPIRVELLEPVSSLLNYDLIEVDAELEEVGKDFVGVEGVLAYYLRCHSEGQFFKVRLPPGMELPGNVKPGARLRVTGICNIISSPERRWFVDVVGFWMQLRGADDLVVVDPAPWITTRRLIWMSAMLLAVVVLFVVWVGMLRRTVNHQTGIIAEKVEQETMLTERQRMSRELHDTLEQGLTALSVQLKNIRTGFKIDEASGLQSVDTAEKMLRVCREESRASVIDLRGGILEKMDLSSAIRHTLELLVKERSVKLQFEVQGSAIPLDPMAERHLLRMVSEAVNNAVKHAEAKHLRVLLSYAEDRLDVNINDDGQGFDQKKTARKGRLGITGMHERANRLHGQLQINSDAGKGTNVSLSMPIQPFLRKDTGYE